MSTGLSVGIIIVLLFLAIIRNIDWKGRALKWVGNNPAKGQIYIRAGRDRHTVEGVRKYISPLAQVYHYTEGKEKTIVIVPGPTPGPEYPYEFIRGRRFIEVEDGQLVATPLSTLSAVERTKYAESVTDISALTEGNAVVNALKSVKRQGSPKWITWIVIAVIVVGVLMFYNNYIKVDDIPVTPGTEQQGQIPPEVLQGVK